MKSNNENPYVKMEEDVLSFWKKSKTFEKSINKNNPKGNYVFNDGPPFITGSPHYATLLPSIAKDVVPRYWTMKGYRVERTWGWDCHGLPAENKVEEQLGLKNKKDVEDLGVDKFVNACRSYVNQGSEQWEWYIDRIGRWVDMKNAYKTMDLEFMESVIWSFKKLYDTGFIYEDYRTSLHCPRCATPLSKFEITMDAGSYREVTEKSVIVKFKVKDSKNPDVDTNTYLLAWTTTPWTLPGNLALAVGENIEYSILKTNTKEKYIIASNRADSLENKEVLRKIKGKDMVGLSYEPIYEINSDEVKGSEKTYKVYTADFVTTEEGTGIVHVAPNFGEDDFNLGEENNLPIIDLMDENGVYLQSSEKWSGYYFKKANRDVLINLQERGIIFSENEHTHTYPFCYRCSTPLIYKTQKAWYLDVQKIKKRMIETNKKINWIPEYFKDGRFKKNIETAPDWCLSRSRYWGSPVPVWKCLQCNEIKVLESIEEIEKLSGKKVKDLHRPDIDNHQLKCSCGGTMKRVREVLDCWFESGAMQFAQFHYPFERAEEFEKMFPADFIIEYTGQLRGWFYYLHLLSNALFNSLSFKNVIVSGVLAGTDGRKMSKSFGNYPDPRMTLEKYGSDALRMYFMNSSIMLGEDTSLSEVDIQNSLRKNVIVLWNVVKFYELFISLNDNGSEINIDSKENILDIWILTRLNQLIKEVTENLEKYNLPEASRPISVFIDDLSTWYTRRSRDRFKGDNEKDKLDAITTTKFVLTETAKIMAPFAPFIAEQVWQKVTKNNFKDKEKSVHLEKWPEVFQVKKTDVLKQMNQVRGVIEAGLSKRDELGIKVRQPLQNLSVKNCYIKEEFHPLILDELNIKNIVFEKGEGDVSVEFDLNITPQLKMEGIKREIVRVLNASRKSLNLTLEDRTKILYSSDSDLINSAINNFKEDILKDTLSIEIKQTKNGSQLKKVKINNDFLGLGVKKID